MGFQDWIRYLSEWIGVVAVTMLLAISPRVVRTKRPLVFQYLRREVIVSVSLYATILAFALVIYFGVIAIPVPAGLEKGLKSLWSQFLLTVVCLLPFLAALYLRKQPPLSIGWKRDMLVPGLQVGLALAFITLFLRNLFLSVLDGLTGLETTALLLYAGIGLAEETIFRGYLQSRLAGKWGPVIGIAASTGLYLLWRLPALLATPEALLITLLLIAVQNVLAGYIFHRIGHVLAPSLYRIISSWITFVM